MTTDVALRQAQGDTRCHAEPAYRTGRLAEAQISTLSSSKILIFRFSPTFALLSIKEYEILLRFAPIVIRVIRVRT